MKIVSRVTQEEEDLWRLKEIIAAASSGAIAEGGNFEPAETLTELITQVDITCAALLETLNVCDARIASQDKDNLMLAAQIAKQEATLSELNAILSGGVEYDEDLDHATMDMMEAFVASGASEPTFDGELSFSETIVISKEDFKPIVKEAIESWLRLKMH